MKASPTRAALQPLLLAALIITGCTHSTNPAPAAKSPPAVVVWVSVDGFRPDYLSRPGVQAPFITSLMVHGAYTTRLTPTYPSLTFSSHTSEATGAYPDVHGIPGNTFFDRTKNETFNFPARPDLLKAEPIWTAAARQGVGVAVFDWPFSQNQKALGVANPTAIYESKFDSKETNEHRLWKPTTRMVERATPPLQFFMAYTDALDHAGHADGPDSPHIVEELNTLDGQLAKLHAAARAYTDRTFSPATPLYFLLSTDHGMSAVHTGFNPNALLKDLLPTPQFRDSATAAPFRIVSGGATAHLFFSPTLSAAEKSTLEATICERLRPYPFCRVYTAATKPPTWHMWDADRVGDLYLDLPKGYTFTSKGDSPVVPVSDVSANLPKGMHSYDPAENSQMLGFTAMSRTPGDFGGQNLGVVDNRRLAPTVAAWLGVSPPMESQVRPLPGVTK